MFFSTLREKSHKMLKNKTDKMFFIVIIILALLCAVLFSILFANQTGILSSHVTQFGLQSIGELATQAGFFTSVQVIENARDVFGVSIPFTAKKYVYSYDGIIKAGLDFQGIDISVDDIQKKIAVTIPETQVFSIEIDPDSFVLYHEGGSVFNALKMDEVNLAEKALKDAIRQRAIDNGLLDEAKSNAELVIRGFLSGTYNLQEYTVDFITKEGN